MSAITLKRCDSLFSIEENLEASREAAAALSRSISTWNRRKELSSIRVPIGTALPMRLLREAPHLARRLWRDPRHFARLLRSIRGALLLVALIAYVLSPLDLLPEAFLGVLGLADDALVVLVGAAIYLAQFREALR